MKITSTKQIGKMPNCKILIYGESGVGKTSLLKSLADCIIISSEKGLLPLRKLDIPVISISTFEELTDALQYFQTNVESIRYKTICMDSISDISEVVLSALLTEYKDGRQAYGKLAQQVSDTVRAFRDLERFNVVMIAKVTTTVNEVTGEVKSGPSMPGNTLTRNLPFWFDEVFIMRIGLSSEGKNYRYLQTCADTDFIAKDRSGVLKEKERPDLQHIINEIKKG